MNQKKMKTINHHRRIELLTKAQDKTNEAIDLIKKAVKDLGQIEREAKVYIIAHLNNWANGTNPYDNHIPNLIEKIERDIGE
jgi:hypothetical protein